ncbi:hypothetical protein M8542_34195 [Amycolatopsis sp. OK19-0408]|uniref:Uncharacterized protein n=1 Tax=Amycolatopsis iheyensis TaxID=2945988 RepID=A0A9X2NFU1_9PSEU|nr:hypothetical protein [Amycolatopsis iheyensis]MCR6487889.1 hypothetical protein [Amycolatopsis iheyensis]
MTPELDVVFPRPDETTAVAHACDTDVEEPGGGSLQATWRTVLPADGNIGIGGAPVRLLRRVRVRSTTGQALTPHRQVSRPG